MATFLVRRYYMTTCSDNREHWCNTHSERERERGTHVITNRPGRMRNLHNRAAAAADLSSVTDTVFGFYLCLFPLIFLIYHYPSDCYSLMMATSSSLVVFAGTLLSLSVSPVWPLTMTFVCHFLFQFHFGYFLSI